MSGLVIRIPVVQRAYVLVFLCLWCGSLMTGFVAAVVSGSTVSIMFLGMLAFGVALGYRLYRVSVVGEADDLVVRNYFRSRRIPRMDVEGFRVGPSSRQPWGKSVHVLLRGEAVLTLDVLDRPYFGARGRRLLAQRVQMLDDWLHGSGAGQ